MKLALVTRKTAIVALVAALGGTVLGIGVERALLAQSQPVTRTVMVRTDAPGATHEILLTIAEIAPGATTGPHRHPGVEVGYVLDGALILEHDGRPTATLKAGDTFKTDGVHNGTNNTRTPVKIVAVYVVEKGKPLAAPVK